MATATPVPLPTATPTPTTRPVPTPTPTEAPVDTPTPTTAPAATPTLTPSPTPTPTLVPTATPLPTPTATVPAVPQSVSLEPSADNTLYESVSGSISNGVGQYLFAGNTRSRNTRRVLVRFDVAGSVPVGATITGVTLTMRVSRTRAGPETTTLHRVLAGWGEGASNASSQEGSGASSRPGDATWRHRIFDTDLWESLGGDFVAEASGSTRVAGIGSYTWPSSAEMVADVQSWLDAPASNHGWLLKGDEDATQTAKRFDSREHPTASNRPQLTIEFTAPG